MLVCWWHLFSRELLRLLKGSMGFRMKRLQTSVDSYLCKTLNIHIQIPAVLQKRKRKLIIKPRHITQNRLLPHVWRLDLKLDKKNASFVLCSILGFLERHSKLNYYYYYFHRDAGEQHCNLFSSVAVILVHFCNIYSTTPHLPTTPALLSEICGGTVALTFAASCNITYQRITAHPSVLTGKM